MKGAASFAKWTGKITRRRALGIYVTDRTVFVAAAVLTPVGIHVQGALQEPLDRECPWKGIKELFGKANREFGTIHDIATHLAVSDVLFVARPVQEDGVAEDYGRPEVLATFLSSVFSPSSVIIEGLFAKSRGEPLFLAAVCKLTTVLHTMQIFMDAKVRVDRFEPIPWVALRHSFHFAPPGQVDEIALRLLVGPSLALGYLLDGSTPLLCLVAHPGDQTVQDDLLRLVRAVESHALSTLGLTLTRGFIQGTDQDMAVALSLMGGLNVEHLPGPALGGEGLALGLALGGVDWDFPAPNMAKRFLPPPSLWTFVNAEEMSLALLFIGLMYAVFFFPIRDLQGRVKSLISMNSQAKWAIQLTNANLIEKHASMEKFSGDYTRFLDDQMVWGDVFVRLARLVPGDARLTALTVTNVGWTNGSPKMDRSLQLSVRGGKEKEFADAIRKDSYLGRVFPSVTLSGIFRGPEDAERSYGVTASGVGLIAPASEDREAKSPSPAKGTGAKAQ